MRYKMHYISGGGKEYNGGVWEKKETAKTILFKEIEPPFFSNNWHEIKIRKFYKGNKPAWRDFGFYKGWMNNGHLLRDWKDGTYTAYPNQCGIPHVFEPI